MPIRHVCKIERLAAHGQTYRFFIRPGSRSRPWHWFAPADVPEFEGREAWFECERIKGGWRVIREVQAPNHAIQQG